VRNVRPAFAIIRIDTYLDNDESRVTVKRVVWDLEVAEAEVLRLNDLNAHKGSHYFWQHTRVDEPTLGGQR
jgi:hypothetical protein